MYIEKILLVDSVIHYSLVNVSSYLTLSKVNKRRFLISILLNLIMVSCYILGQRGIGIYLTSSIICIYPFYTKNIKKIFKPSFIYLMLNFLLGGIVEAVYLTSIVSTLFIFIILVILIISVVIYKLIYNIKINLNNLYYDLILIDKKNKYIVKAYLDTGNFMESNNRSIMILNIGKTIGRKIGVDYSTSISGTKEISLYEVDRIYLKKDKKYIEIDAYLIYENIKFDALIGLNIIGG